jgi:hypothetical protein
MVFSEAKWWQPLEELIAVRGGLLEQEQKAGPDEVSRLATLTVRFRYSTSPAPLGAHNSTM